MLLPRSKAKDERAAKSATAAATICDLCDVYTQNDIEGKWNELLKVYDVRVHVLGSFGVAVGVIRLSCVFAVCFLTRCTDACD